MQTKYSKTNAATIQACVKAGMQRAAIAQHLNLEPARLNATLTVLALTAKNTQSNPAKSTTEAKIKNAADNGLSLLDAAAHLGISYGMLRKVAGCLDIKFRHKTVGIFKGGDSFKYKAHNPFQFVILCSIITVLHKRSSHANKIQ